MYEALIKIGGSLYHHPDLRGNMATWAKLAVEHRLLFLPGGGPFAAAVRAADDRFNLSDRTAHWMAILAMDQFAYLLADLTSDACLVRDLSTAAAVSAGGQPAILAPSTLLRALDPLPPSWQVTSDSIAAWLAKYLNIPRLVLLKSVAGVYHHDDERGESKRLRTRIPIQHLTINDIVDPYFGQTLSPATRCWIVDGRQPERLVELLQRGRTVGTELVAG